MKKPKILIIGTHRSGTTNLFNAFNRIFHTRSVDEPFNHGLNEYILGIKEELFSYPDEIKHFTLVKSLINHKPKNWESSIDFYKDYSKHFDHIVVLGRRDLEAMAVSYARAVKTGHWHSEYTIANEDYLDINIKLQVKVLKMLIDTADSLNVEVTWYEDLYSGDFHKFKNVVSKWNIDINFDTFFKYFNPKDKYRKFINSKTTI